MRASASSEVTLHTNSTTKSLFIRLKTRITLSPTLDYFIPHAFVRCAPERRLLHPYLYPVAPAVVSAAWESWHKSHAESLQPCPVVREHIGIDRQLHFVKLSLADLLRCRAGYGQLAPCAGVSLRHELQFQARAPDGQVVLFYDVDHTAFRHAGGQRRPRDDLPGE